MYELLACSAIRLPVKPGLPKRVTEETVERVYREVREQHRFWIITIGITTGPDLIKGPAPFYSSLPGCVDDRFGVMPAERITEQEAAALQRFRTHLESVVAYLGKMAGLQTRYEEHEHFQFMALSYFSKQLTHARALLTLGESRDVLLIARTMLEGYLGLAWAERHPERRALQWRAYVLVCDWRMLTWRKNQGLEYDQGKLAETVERLREHEELLLTKKAKKGRARGQPLPADPYLPHWPPIQIKQIMEQLEVPDLNDNIYRTLSAYHHWSADGLVRGIRRTEGSVLYSDKASALDQKMALLCATSCLGQTTKIANNAVKLVPRPEMERIERETKELYTANWPTKEAKIAL